jgi:hypothetical protein
MRMRDLPMFKLPMFGLVYNNFLLAPKRDGNDIVIDGCVRIKLGDAAVIKVVPWTDIKVDGMEVVDMVTILPSAEMHTLMINSHDRDPRKLQFFFGWDYPVELRRAGITSVPLAA